MRGVTLIGVLILVLLSGCSTNLVTKHNEFNPPESSVINKESIEQIHVIDLGITFEDQKEVEELIKVYFAARERKDYKKEWELMSSNERSLYGNYETFKKTSENSIIESAKLISMKGYIPPFKTKEFVAINDVPEGMPTVWFEASFDLKLKGQHAIWKNGVNTRFVIVDKESDGKWKIGGLATSP